MKVKDAIRVIGYVFHNSCGDSLIAECFVHPKVIHLHKAVILQRIDGANFLAVLVGTQPVIIGMGFRNFQYYLHIPVCSGLVLLRHIGHIQNICADIRSLNIPNLNTVIDLPCSAVVFQHRHHIGNIRIKGIPVQTRGIHRASHAEHRVIQSPFYAGINSRLHIIGGGSKNRLLNQLTANAIGRKVVAGPSEATAIGNVMIQAMAAGVVSSLQEMRSIIHASVETEEFAPELVAEWEEAYQKFVTLK